MSQFLKDLGSTARKAGMMAGASAGLTASGSVWSTAIASGTAIAVNPAALCIALPVAGAWVGWRAVKVVTDVVDKAADAAESEKVDES